MYTGQGGSPGHAIIGTCPYVGRCHGTLTGPYRRSSSASRQMLSVRPGMSESEHSIDTGLIDRCPIDLQRHSRLHMEAAMREILQGDETCAQQRV